MATGNDLAVRGARRRAGRGPLRVASAGARLAWVLAATALVISACAVPAAPPADTVDPGAPAGEAPGVPEGEGLPDTTFATEFLDSLTEDRTDADDAAITELSEAFISTWVDAGYGSFDVTTIEMHDAVLQELTALGIASSDVIYHPELRTFMVLGGGGQYGVMVDENDEPRLGALQKFAYATPGRWVMIDDLAAEFDEAGLEGRYCTTYHIARVGHREWASVPVDGRGSVRFHDSTGVDPIATDGGYCTP